jgi:hypothetical protein
MVDGVAYSTMSEAAKACGLSIWTLRRTLDQGGWKPLTAQDIREAIGRSRQRRSQRRVYTEPWTDHTGREHPSFTAMCEAWGVRRDLVKHRIKRGWSIEAALTVPLYGKREGESDGGD